MSRFVPVVLSALAALAGCPGASAVQDGSVPVRVDGAAQVEADRGPAVRGPPVVEFLPQRVRVRVELARTEAEVARGLMYREHLPEGEGMLFVFPEESDRTFWMRNTLIPLDMIFVDAGGTVVGVVHEAAPLTDAPRYVERPSRYVIEVPGGFARAHGLGPGTRVRFENVEP